MIYELSTNEGYRVGIFPTVTEACYHASYLPKGEYTISEWTEDGEYLTFDPKENKTYHFNN
ncbi:hypothetical protein [uncultured Parabacteroides sp.]|uniref:hypothetical protein n=1 Tax=uncultured Parabacteroides sp. TaxID=512312 RepID=UPI0026ED5C31|nr:hypothetical protein [uncultured Parabacteroides sp.]